MPDLPFCSPDISCGVSNRGRAPRGSLYSVFVRFRKMRPFLRMFYFHLAENHCNVLILYLENSQGKYTNLQHLCHERQAPLRGRPCAVHNLPSQALPSWLFSLYLICVLPSSTLMTEHSAFRHLGRNSKVKWSKSSSC